MAANPPAPTAPPSSVLVGRRLAARQGAPQTCGWIDANPSQPAVCSAGSTCAVNTAYNVHYCCPSFPCTPPTTCYGALALSTACDDACSANPLILKCPSGYDYCYTRYWSEATPLIGFGCANSAFVETVYTTNSLGQGKIAAGSTFGLTVAGAAATTAGSIAANSPSTVTVPASTAGSTVISSGGTGGSGSTSSSSPVDIGEIVGITIASVFGVIILVLVALYLALWRPRQKERERQREEERARQIKLRERLERDPKPEDSASQSGTTSWAASSGGDHPTQLPSFANTVGHGVLAPSSTGVSTWISPSSTNPSELNSEGRGRIPSELLNPIRAQRG